MSYPYAAYPAGIKTSFPLQFIPVIPLLVLPRGELLTYNLIIVIGIALNGFVMFLLGRKLFNNNFAAFAMGLLFMFAPYALARSRYHFMLAQIFIFPLLLYVLLNLKENFTKGNKVKFFFALLLALNIHPYYSLMALLMLAILTLYFVIKHQRSGELKQEYRFIKTCLIIGVLALLITLPISFIQIGGGQGGLSVMKRQEGDLYSYAAHPWNYIVPSPNSTFFGDSVKPFISGKLSTTNVQEYILFLGYTNLGIAMVTLVLWLFRRRSGLAKQLTEEIQDRSSWAIPFALMLGIVAFLLSLQPTMKAGGTTLYLPAWLMYKIIPSVRVLSRFGILVFFSITILTGAGIAFLSKALKGKGRFISVLVVTLLIALMIGEFLEIGHNPVQKLYDNESSYVTLKDIPNDPVIVEYPFVASDESYNSVYLWNQLFHKKKMLNGFPLGTEGESMRNSMLNILDPQTPGLLAYMDISYVVVHKDFYITGSEYSYPPQNIDLDKLPSGLEKVDADQDTEILKVIASRPDTVTLYDPKFSTVITREFGNGWWLGGEKQWSIRVDSTFNGIADIRFSILSPKGERRLQVDLGEGRKEAFRIRETSTNIMLGKVQLQKGMNTFYLSSNEDPVPYNAVFGGNDNKPLCFAMSFWRVNH